jgi:hypothetical protein
LTVERQVFDDTAVRVSYIGTRGLKQVWFWEVNIPRPSTTAFTQARRPYPQFTSIRLQENGSGHLYQALQVQVEHRGKRGLYFRSHYTWAKDVGDNQGQREDTVLDPFNRRADKGDLFYLPRHRFITEFDWELPVGRGRAFGANLPAALDYVVGGWRLNGIFNAGTGNFLTPGYSGYDATGTGLLGGRPDRIADGNLPSGQRTADRWFDASALTLPGGASTTSPPIGRFGNAGVGIIEGPGYWQYDLGLAKGFPLPGEKLRLNIFVLGTNIFNHPNLADPNMNISTPNAVGRISGIRFDGNASGIGMRQIQLGLRLEF